MKKREKLLVLAKTYPTVSKTYEHLVCIAGITEDGEWRRIYPVPWKLFWKGSEKKFKKKCWISYELRSDKPSDRRPESRKIDFNSIKVHEEEDYRTIKKMLDERLTTLEDLQSQDDKVVSLGVLRPEILDFVWEDSEYYAKVQDMARQVTLEITLGTGKSAVRIKVPDKKFQYVFKCNPECPKRHKIMCEDWELGMLYLNSLERHKDREIAAEKVREKFLGDIPERKYVYFVVGTHNKYPNTWLIVSVLYPKKSDIPLIETPSLDEVLS